VLTLPYSSMPIALEPVLKLMSTGSIHFHILNISASVKMAFSVDVEAYFSNKLKKYFDGVLIDGEVKNKRLKVIFVTAIRQLRKPHLVKYEFEESGDSITAQISSIPDSQLGPFFSFASVHLVYSEELYKILCDNMPKIHSFVLLSTIIPFHCMPFYYAEKADDRLILIANQLRKSLNEDEGWIEHPNVRALIRSDTMRQRIDWLEEKIERLRARLIEAGVSDYADLYPGKFEKK